MYGSLDEKEEYTKEEDPRYSLVPSSATSVEICSQAEGARGTSETPATTTVPCDQPIFVLLHYDSVYVCIQMK